ncbi:MAG: hypothetical protein ACREI3_09845, partial [Nitrospirales bacterium]
VSYMSSSWRAWVVLFLVLLGQGAVVSADSPALLLFEAPEAWQALAERLRGAEPYPSPAALKAVGLKTGGEPIRVILATASSPLASRVPSWAAGYAAGRHSVVVLFPDRVPTYPADSLESVLTHELVHVLITRTAGGRSVPRWFDEGLAMVLAREWGWEDRSRLVWAMVSGTPVSFEDLDAWFHQERGSATRAYVLAAAFLRDLIRDAGVQAPGQILALVEQGWPFDAAFQEVTSRTPAEAEALFWKNQTFWNRWVPVVTSSVTLWMGITLLTLFAYRKQRRRTAAIRKRWQVEDQDPFLGE